MQECNLQWISFIAFDLLKFSANVPQKVMKRPNSGHEKSVSGMCITCFENKRRMFTLSRFNESTINRHKKLVHQGKDAVIVSSDHPRAIKAKRDMETSAVIENK